MRDPTLPDRLAALLPGAWQPCPQGYALATPAGLLTVRAPHNQYLIRLGDADALKTYAAAALQAAEQAYDDAEKALAAFDRENPA